jgi:formiminoglutamase
MRERPGHFARMQSFEPIDPGLRFTRNDSRDPRLGDLSKENTEEGVAILGYPDDEGVRLNGGREGARQGPDEIRRQLYKMTPHPRRKLKSFADFGNLNPDLDADLATRHARATEAVKMVLDRGLQALTLGGGNDYAYGDGRAFLQACPTRPLVINVDAHFDVRDTSRGLSSGTPFYRLLESGPPFDFAELGIQTHCNSREHWDYVSGKGGCVLTMDEILESGLSFSECAVRKLDDWIFKRRPVFLAIDMDAFAYPYAAGTSAAWPLGLLPHDFWPFFNVLLTRMDVRVLGLYEVAPSLEAGVGTSKLAAQFAHGFLHHV